MQLWLVLSWASRARWQVAGKAREFTSKAKCFGWLPSFCLAKPMEKVIPYCVFFVCGLNNMKGLFFPFQAHCCSLSSCHSTLLVPPFHPSSKHSLPLYCRKLPCDIIGSVPFLNVVSLCDPPLSPGWAHKERYLFGLLPLLSSHQAKTEWSNRTSAALLILCLETAATPSTSAISNTCSIYSDSLNVVCLPESPSSEMGGKLI